MNKDVIERYNDAKLVDDVPPELDIEYHKLNDYAEIMTNLRKEIKDTTDRDERFEIDQYIIGLARLAMDRRNREDTPTHSQIGKPRRSYR